MTSESAKARFHLKGKTILYAICSYHCTYALTYALGFIAPVYPEQCMYRSMPRMEYGKVLFAGIEGELRPKRTFVYYDFKDYLSDFLSHRDIKAVMDQHVMIS